MPVELSSPTRPTGLDPAEDGRERGRLVALCASFDSAQLAEVERKFDEGDYEGGVLRLWGIASASTEERDGRELAAAVSLARELVSGDAPRKTRSSARHLLETYEPILKNGSTRWHDWGSPEWAIPPPVVWSAPRLRTAPKQTVRYLLKTLLFSAALYLVAAGAGVIVALIAASSGAPAWVSWVSTLVVAYVIFWREARWLFPRAYPQWRATELAALLPVVVGWALVVWLVWLAVTKRRWPPTGVPLR
jgi:hypothetical protein